jgi:hypothetical protein
MIDAGWALALQERRAEIVRSIRDPQRSPYAAVARSDFSGEAPLRFGSAADCDVRLDAASAHHLKVSVVGGSFQVDAEDAGVSFRVLAAGGEGDGRLRSARVEAGARIEISRYTLRLSHQNFPGVLVLDPQSPRLASGPPPRWFAPDPAFRVAARLARDPAPREEVVLSTRGNKRRALRVGALAFDLLGERLRLAALRLLEPGIGEAELSIFFRDRTSGEETYPVGRYLDPEPVPGAGDEYLLDFNDAYNPTCAFSPLYNCPIPPRENAIPLAVRAGEMHPHAHGD